MQAIIFDFDGLIVDTETAWYEAFKDVLQTYGLALTVEQFSKVIGTDDTILYSYIEENLETPVGREIIRKAAHDHFHEKMGEPALRDGVEDYLIEAKQLGLKIGLASSSRRDWVVHYLKKFSILEYFDVIKTRDDVSVVKPNPELYIKAVEALEVPASEALAFEDSLNGLTAARAAGILCVVVPNAVTEHLTFLDHSLKLSSMADLSLTQVLSAVGQKKGDDLENYTIRLAAEADEEFLWEMLYQAIYIPEGKPRPSKDILKEPHIAQSLSGWGRRGDIALIAVTTNHKPMGAVWVRLFDEMNKTYGYVDSSTPLLGMALLPEFRGRGIGKALLGKMLKVSKESGYQAVSLSVDPNNPALHLYQMFGFKKIGVDGTSWDMVVRF
jgi:putative hydrolase of the HAD superfamily